MADDGPESLVLRYLRKLDADIGNLRDDMREVKMRLASVETAVLDMRRDLLNLHGDAVALAHRMDRLDVRLTRIERRLDLHESETV